MTSVVVVESPAKAKTINRYLGPGYTVLASFGHIRDLPSKDGSVRPNEDFAMDWDLDAKSAQRMGDIAKALKGADRLFLATDPDREGEAISWHVREVLDKRKVLNGVEVKRVVFNEITKTAIRKAFESPRDLDRELIESYLARRALDYLVGFTLSPVLWRKLPGSRSAGRVQSVALRLICEREAEIENFRAQEYWSITATLSNIGGREFTAGLVRVDGERLDKHDIPDETRAMELKSLIESKEFLVTKIERKQAKRNPAPPFMTSTLQMEAGRRLYFPAKKTMRVAQKLYEGVDLGGETVGLITYMRTDGAQMAGEAIEAARIHIGQEFDSRYLPEKPRIYKTKAKNAQEAHEAIRPTDVKRAPKSVRRYLDDDQYKIYELIWRRAVASQMASAVIDQVAVDLEPGDGSATLRANGSVVAFDGFTRLYRESGLSTDKESDDGDRRLPDLRRDEIMVTRKVKADRHFTQPPPRYSEASLVKRLEELGIGRPSTYSPIMSVLRDRNYVTLDKRRFAPEDRGRLVTAFLETFFARYVEYDFTAELEEKLDDISGGRVNWKRVLREFWDAFSAKVDETRELRISNVIDALDELLGPHFFREDGVSDPRRCPSCADGRLSLKLGKFGAFIGCSNYPDCKFTRPLEIATDKNSSETAAGGPKVLGRHPETGEEVTLRKGPYGYYVQMGDQKEIQEPGKTLKSGKPGRPKIKKIKPKRSSLTRDMAPETVDLDMAAKLLALPRHIGDHPETGLRMVAGIGRFGPYIKHGEQFISLKGDDDVLTIGMNRAVEVVANAPRKEPPVELGDHPDDKKPVRLKTGRWGPYVQHGKLMATLPKGTDKKDVTLEFAVATLKAKADKETARKAAPKRKSPTRRGGETPRKSRTKDR